MGVLDTTYTFTATDVVTSAKLNNVIDQTTFTATAVTGATLAVSASGQLRVNTITSNEMGGSSVNSTALADNSVITAKLADNSVITAKILDANVTQAKIAPNVVGKGPFVRVSGSTTTFGVGGVGTKIAFTTVSNDTNSNWNSATNTFTCTVSGYYLITCRISCTSAPVGMTPLILLNDVNSVPASEVNTGTHSSGISDVFEINAGNTIKANVYSQQAGTLGVANLSIVLVRAI